MELLILLIIIVPVIAVVIYLTTKADSYTVYLHPEDDKKWKRVVYVMYQDRILTITTFDNNIREFYHGLNDPGLSQGWFNYITKTKVKDKYIIDSLDRLYISVLGRGKRKREGWVLSL